MTGIHDMYNAIVAALRRFRVWQHHPFNNKNLSDGALQHCMNCGTDFADNYCPRCGQKAGTGRLTWANVKERAGYSLPVTWWPTASSSAMACGVRSGVCCSPYSKESS